MSNLITEFSEMLNSCACLDMGEAACALKKGSKDIGPFEVTLKLPKVHNAIQKIRTELRKNPPGWEELAGGSEEPFRRTGCRFGRTLAVSIFIADLWGGFRLSCPCYFWCRLVQWR